MNEAKLVVRPAELRPMAKQVVGGAIDKSSPLKIFKILRAAGKKIKVEKGGDTSRTGRKIVIEKSVSKQQQKFMGMVRAVQKGEMDAQSPEVAKVAKTMKKKDVEDFAKTKHKGLPNKKKADECWDGYKQVGMKKKGNKMVPDCVPEGKSFFAFREEINEASIKDIKDILTTIGSSKNMNQAVQMVMKKYKVDQGKAKAMVKKAIDSGVTYDKIKKKYAKESVDEASLKTSDYPKGTSMSARKFKDSQKKMSKQRALTTKDYPKGTSMSATAWKNRQEEVDEAKVRGADAYDKTFANRKQADKFAREMGGRVKQVGRVFYVFKESVDEASILRTKTTRKQSAASKEKDRKKAVKTFQDIRKGKYPGVKFAEETLDEKFSFIVRDKDGKIAGGSSSEREAKMMASRIKGKVQPLKKPISNKQLDNMKVMGESVELDEASIQDIQGILTTIAKSQNMNQAVQMVMKKYKVDQGKAKAMVKKAIDSGVTYDKIKKKYAK